MTTAVGGANVNSTEDELLKRAQEEAAARQRQKETDQKAPQADSTQAINENLKAITAETDNPFAPQSKFGIDSNANPTLNPDPSKEPNTEAAAQAILGGDYKANDPVHNAEKLVDKLAEEIKTETAVADRASSTETKKDTEQSSEQVAYAGNPAAAAAMVGLRTNDSAGLDKLSEERRASLENLGDRARALVALGRHQEASDLLSRYFSTGKIDTTTGSAELKFYLSTLSPPHSV